MLRLEIAYALLVLLMVALATTAFLFVRHRRREHERIWGKRRNRPLE
ncbi:hypothetical protein [Sphingomonas sp. 66-10]|nr:hypothetical protein [Sphingomonas sp. 66-10]